MKIRFTFLIILLFSYNSFSQNNKSLLEFDHVPIVVRNLDSAKKIFMQHGFKIKPGYKHKNGITNFHIKFSKFNSLEVLSIENPSDQISKSYINFLEDGEGATFLALRILDLEKVKEALTSNGIQFKIIETKLFDYLIFKSPLLQHIFLMKYNFDFENAQSEKFLNENFQISKILVDGNDLVRKFFKLFGVRKNKNLYSLGNFDLKLNQHNHKLFRVRKVYLNQKNNQIVNKLILGVFTLSF